MDRIDRMLELLVEGRQKTAAAWRDVLSGGRADLNKPSDFPKATLSEGRKHEHEHTDSAHVATEIAMDHLKEDPKYYEKVQKLEKAAEEFKLQGHRKFQGLRIAVENRKGSVRKGVDKDGKPWRTEMKHPYGYIKGTKGADGEEVDCYVGPRKDATHAHVVHQHKADGKGYDEDKVMLGFASKQEAKDAYLAHYNSPKFLGPMKSVPMERFKQLVESGKKLMKIAFSESSFSGGTDFRTPVRPSHQTPGYMPRIDRGGSPVRGGGFEPTRGGFMLASGVQGPVGLTKAAEDKEKDSDGLPDFTTYEPGDFKPARLNGRPKLASPGALLAQSRKVGKVPNQMGSRGPSIQQVAKPFGFSRAGAVAGTEKGGRI